jgi:hypothetical protein
MALINFSIQHKLSHEEAKARLASAAGEVRKRYGPLVQQAEWSADREVLTVRASGAVAEMHAEADRVHATIDVPVLSGLLGGRMTETIKDIVRRQLGGPG